MFPPKVGGIFLSADVSKLTFRARFCLDKKTTDSPVVQKRFKVISKWLLTGGKVIKVI